MTERYARGPAVRPGVDADRLDKPLDRAARDLELSDPDQGLPVLERTVNRIAEVFGGSLLIAVFLIVLCNAFGRYLFAAPVVWAEEVVNATIPWLAMAGLFLSVRRRRLIRITFFEERFSPTLRALIAVSAQLLCCAAFGLVAWLTIGHVSQFGGDPTPVLGMPKGLTDTAMLVGGAAVAIAFAIEAWRRLRQPGGGEPTR